MFSESMWRGMRVAGGGSQSRSHGLELLELARQPRDEGLGDMRQGTVARHEEADLERIQLRDIERPPDDVAAPELLDEGDLREDRDALAGDDQPLDHRRPVAGHHRLELVPELG